MQSRKIILAGSRWRISTKGRPEPPLVRMGHALTGEPPLVAQEPDVVPPTLAELNCAKSLHGSAANRRYTVGLEAQQEATQHTLPAVACLLTVRPHSSVLRAPASARRVRRPRCIDTNALVGGLYYPYAIAVLQGA